MVIGLRRRLGFLSRPLELVPDEPELEPEIAPKPPEVEFAGYAEDCRIYTDTLVRVPIFHRPMSNLIFSLMVQGESIASGDNPRKSDSCPCKSVSHQLTFRPCSGRQRISLD